jgi:hypothetical protein
MPALTANLRRLNDKGTARFIRSKVSVITSSDQWGFLLGALHRSGSRGPDPAPH